ncbi:MAG: glycosyltransferase [Deltaproteobacteria bacterium]|nr:glycosyltransferase [Deltaproteobacteria bacterium]
MPETLAIFLATSGHSGVDRVMGNLIRELSSRGLAVDLLRIKGHGPYLPDTLPLVRKIELSTSHVNSALIPLVRYLKQEAPPVILTDKDRVNRIALLARRIANVPTRVAIRVGTTVSQNLARRGWLHRTMQYFSIRHFYPWADTIIVPSRGAAEDLARIARLPVHHIKVLPSPVVGPELDRLSQEVPDHPWFRETSPPIILGVGELCARKDFATLIRAFAKIRSERPCRLVILGEGRKRSELQRLAADLGIGDEVSLPGFVPNPYAFMKRATLFVLSSNCEGAPVVLIESLALGLPAVSTDCPSGPREILQDGRIGPLVPIGDNEALARAINATLDNPPDPALLRFAATPYSVKESADRYLAALGLLP